VDLFGCLFGGPAFDLFRILALLDSFPGGLGTFLPNVGFHQDRFGLFLEVVAADRFLFGERMLGSGLGAVVGHASDLPRSVAPLTAATRESSRCVRSRTAVRPVIGSDAARARLVLLIIVGQVAGAGRVEA